MQNSGFDVLLCKCFSDAELQFIRHNHRSLCIYCAMARDLNLNTWCEIKDDMWIYHNNMLQVNKGMKFPVSHQSPLDFASSGLSVRTGLQIRLKNSQAPQQCFMHMQTSVECLNLNLWQGRLGRNSRRLKMTFIWRTMSCHENLWPPRFVVWMFFRLRTHPFYIVQWRMT